MKSAVTLAACMAAALGAWAQPTPEPPQSWPKEPEAFLGITVGEPENIQPCPTKMAGRLPIVDYAAVKSLEGVCKDPELLGGDIHLWNLPELGFPYVARVGTKQGVVTRVILTLSQGNFSRMYAAFKERYGEPVLVELKTVKTTMGAEFSSTEATWRGRKLSIVAWERFDKIDRSMIVVGSIETMRQEREKDKTKRSSGIQKF